MRKVKVTSDPRSAYLDKQRDTRPMRNVRYRSEETFDIEIIKVFFNGKFSHWEFKSGANGIIDASGTAPRWTGVIDMAIETLEAKVNWLKDDANEVNR